MYLTNRKKPSKRIDRTRNQVHFQKNIMQLTIITGTNTCMPSLDHLYWQYQVYRSAYLQVSQRQQGPFALSKHVETERSQHSTAEIIVRAYIPT